MSRKPRRSTSPTAIVKTMAPRTHRGRYWQRAGQEEEHERDDPGGRQVRELAAPAGAFDHRGLRRAAVHHERAAERRGRIGRRQTHEVRVFVERFAMARRIGARRRCALGDDHQKARGRHRDKRQGLRPSVTSGTPSRGRPPATGPMTVIP